MASADVGPPADQAELGPRSDSAVAPADGGADGIAPGAAAAPKAGTPGAVTPPHLIAAGDAIYPPQAEAAGVEGTVVLVVTVDASGTVAAAEVVQPLGYGLDEVARDAALRSRFEPARRDGRPVSARIRFERRFQLSSKEGGGSALTEPPAPAIGPPPLATRASPPPRTGPPAIPAPSQETVDVIVRGVSAAQRRRASAEAVTVVDLQRAQGESADLGEILAHVPGLSVRRSGGLGSYARVSINGLTDEQVRFYLDGLPLDAAGLGVTPQNTPVNFIERLEIYKGVVPVRFGADALGGAIDLVTLDDVRGTHATASAELGSFGTARFALAARHTRRATGLYTAVSAFLDHADNDYPVDSVPVPNAQGQPVSTSLHLFHNGYRGQGLMADVGFVDRPWARRLLLRVFETGQSNELQSNYVMTVPYGEARYWQTGHGVNLRYEQPRLAGSALGTNVIVAVSRRTINFQDQSDWVYDWFGQRVRQRAQPGEIGQATDQTIRDDKVLARLGVSWKPLDCQELRLALAPTFDGRSGRDHAIATGRDPLGSLRRYLTVTVGGEYQVDLLERRLQAITFGKGYGYATWAEEPLTGGGTARRDQSRLIPGGGEELRYRIRPALWVKASYEWTTRFPSPDEVFGDGVRVLANLGLMPERSHNANLGLTVDNVRSGAGLWRGEVNLFFRQASDLIVFLQSMNDAHYDNVNTARSQGMEASAGWTSPREHVVLDGNATWQSLRNRSSTGTFGTFEGDRIPNRPWLFTNLSARVQQRGVSAAGDELALGYALRYVHGYFRSWESVGLVQTKQAIPAQLTHDVVLSYTLRGRLHQTWTLEADNLTDARVFDFYGLQRPGRAFYAKVTAEF